MLFHSSVINDLEVFRPHTEDNSNHLLILQEYMKSFLKGY